MTVHYQRFAIYSNDPNIAFPLVELSFKRQDIIDGIKAKTFDAKKVGESLQEFAKAIQAAINEGLK